MESNYDVAMIGVFLAVTLAGLIFVFIIMKKSDTDDNKKESCKEPAKEEEKYPAGKLNIYFGSQTGTAEGFARTLMDDGRQLGFDAKIVDLEDFEPEEFTEEIPLSVFLMATYGEGEATDNAARFYKWIKDDEGDLNSAQLSKLKYTVFGLGNKQYEHFNRMGKLTDKLLAKSGASRAFEYGEGDDDNALEEDFEEWKTKLWPSLLAQFHPTAASRVKKDEHSRVELGFTAVKSSRSGSNNNSSSSLDSSHIQTSSKHFFKGAPRANILVNRELRIAGPDKDSGSTRHIEIDLKSVGLQYSTADNLAILPENNASKVSALAKALDFDLNEVVELKGTSADFKHPFPTPCTIKEILTSFVDIQGYATRHVLNHLVAYITNPAQKAWLLKLLDKNNHSIFKSCIEDKCTSVYDLLTSELDSCKLPLSDLLNIVPLIQPRYYTISSSSSLHPDTVHITVSLTEYAIPGSNQKFVGLTSGFLKSLTGTCRVYVRASSFRLPQTLSTPIIMIGPGTGVAPMRALLQERKFKGGKNAGSNTLYFGCKNKAVDYIYRDELEAYEEEGVLTKMHLAFSRHGPKKVYVQHMMETQANARALWEEVHTNGGYVYVCGATAMGHDVMNMFLKVVEEYKGVGKEEALAYVKSLRDQGRYVQELWTA